MDAFGTNNLRDDIAGRRLLTIEAVADRCGVSIRTVYRWLSREGLPIHELPGAGSRPIRRIAETDLETWLGSHRFDPEDQKEHEQVIRLEGQRFLRPSTGKFGKRKLDPGRQGRSCVPVNEDEP